MTVKQLLLASGKGGTGKTSICASFVSLATNVLIADADVDASDLPLLLNPDYRNVEKFFSGKEALIDPLLCTNCGICATHCRFNAIFSSNKSTVHQVDPVACDGCGLCALICPEKAIRLDERECGLWYLSQTRFGAMVHAKLHPGGENSGKLVHLVRQKAILEAQKNNSSLIIIDGPPGVACPVIASITGCDAVVVVAEPSLSSQHDADRMIKLARHFRIPAFLIINKWDIDEDFSESMIRSISNNGVHLLGKIPYDPAFTQAMLQQKTLIEYAPESQAARAISSIWDHLKLFI